MAQLLSKTGITTAQTVRAAHVTQSVDAFTAVKAYDITLSGSLEVTGSISFTNFVAAGGGFGNSREISYTQTIPPNFNAILYTSNIYPSITINSGINYTISAGADVALHNINQ